jgi:hypothetical protein
MKPPEFGPPTVVFLDRARFIVAWSASRQSEQAAIAGANETGWRSDRKFKDAEQGFSPGGASPVPVGSVSLEATPGGPPAITFVGGITRTIWLLANGARVVPVGCEIDTQIGILDELVGAANPLVSSEVELVP